MNISREKERMRAHIPGMRFACGDGGVLHGTGYVYTERTECVSSRPPAKRYFRHRIPLICTHVCVILRSSDSNWARMHAGKLNCRRRRRNDGRVKSKARLRRRAMTDRRGY